MLDSPHLQVDAIGKEASPEEEQEEEEVEIEVRVIHLGCPRLWVQESQKYPVRPEQEEQAVS